MSAVQTRTKLWTVRYDDGVELLDGYMRTYSSRREARQAVRKLRRNGVSDARVAKVVVGKEKGLVVG